MAEVELDIPEVSGFAQQAKFFRQEGKDFVEISFIGNPDTVIQKVTPEIMARYRTAWNAYCDGVPLKQRSGTPLTDLKEINAEISDRIIKQNVHSLEELAALNDHQCQALGHGILTLRGQAQKLVALRAMERRDADVKKISSAVSKPLAEQPDPEVGELKEIVKQQGAALAQISENMVAMMGAIKELANTKPAKHIKKGARQEKYGAIAADRDKKNGPKLDTGNNEPSV